MDFMWWFYHFRINLNQIVFALLSQTVKDKDILIVQNHSLVSFKMQGEVLGMRMVNDENTQDEGDGGSPCMGELKFDDGGMRGLAASLCWVGLVYRCSREDDADLAHPMVSTLVRSLLKLPTIRKSQGSDLATEQIRRIIRQNVESKKMAISSFEWAEILRGMNKLGRAITVQEAIDLYNSSPEINAHGGSVAGSKARWDGRIQTHSRQT